jgi:hypothetical protein
MSEARPTNPYESPREATSQKLPDFSERDAELADLRRRVIKMEEQLSRSWFHGGVWRKMLAVWAYFMLGYALIAGVAFVLMWVIDALNPFAE